MADLKDQIVKMSTMKADLVGRSTDGLLLTTQDGSNAVCYTLNPQRAMSGYDGKSLRSLVVR